MLILLYHSPRHWILRSHLVLCVCYVCSDSCKIQRRTCNAISPDLTSRFKSHFLYHEAVFLCLYYKYFHAHLSDALSSCVPRHYELKYSTRSTAIWHPFIFEIARNHRKFYANSFFSSLMFKNLNSMSILIFCCLYVSSFLFLNP